MATQRLEIAGYTPDTSGKVFLSPVSTQLSLTNSRNHLIMVMQEPAAGGDVGVEGRFTIPKDYVGTPELVIRGILDGTPANTLAFGCSFFSEADSESADQAYDTEDLVQNSTWTGYADEDSIEMTITLTPAAAFVADDIINFFFFWDDSVASPFTGNFLLEALYFQYADA